MNAYYDVYQKFPNFYLNNINGGPISPIANRNYGVHVYNCKSNAFQVSNFNNSNLTYAQNQNLNSKYRMRFLIFQNGNDATGVKSYHPFTTNPNGFTSIPITASSLGMPLIDGQYYNVYVLLYVQSDEPTISSKYTFLRDFEFSFYYHTSVNPNVVEQKTFVGSKSGPIDNFPNAPGKNITISTIFNTVNMLFEGSTSNAIINRGFTFEEVDCNSVSLINSLCSVTEAGPWPSDPNNIYSVHDYCYNTIGPFSDPSLIGKCFKTTIWASNPCGVVSQSEHFKITGFSFKAPDNPELLKNPQTENDHLLIYPNPSDGIINIQGSAAIDQTINFKLIDVTGKIVASSKFPLKQGDFNIQLDKIDLKPGMYFTQFELNNQPVMQKIIIK